MTLTTVIHKIYELSYKIGTVSSTGYILAYSCFQLSIQPGNCGRPPISGGTCWPGEHQEPSTRNGTCTIPSSRNAYKHCYSDCSFGTELYLKPGTK